MARHYFSRVTVGTQDATQAQPEFLLLAPQIAGHAGRRYVLGSHSGTAAIGRLLRQAGIRVSPKQARALKPLLHPDFDCSC